MGKKNAFLLRNGRREKKKDGKGKLADTGLSGRITSENGTG